MIFICLSKESDMPNIAKNSFWLISGLTFFQIVPVKTIEYLKRRGKQKTCKLDFFITHNLIFQG